MSNQTKLIKNTKIVKFPRITKSVKNALERAVRISKEQKWEKVVIIGFGKDLGNYVTNNLDTHTIVGMASDMKYIIQKDIYG